MSDNDVSIKLTGDNSDFNAKVEQAKQKVKGLGDETGASLEKGGKRGSKALDAYVASLERAAANAGKSSREVKLEELAQRGATAEVIKRADAALRLLETQKAQAREARNVEAAARQAAAMQQAADASEARRAARQAAEAEAAQRRATISAQKQAAQLAMIENAQRQRASRMGAFQATQLSYQLNDLFVQIASGQSPVTALVQQGSQLSGAFGGFGNALRAVGALFTPFRIAVGGAAAAVGALSYVMYRGAENSKEFADAIVKSGNMAGQTEGQFLDLTNRVAESSKSSVKSVREIAQALISSGQIGADSFSGATEAAVAYSKITGKTAEDVAVDFAKMSQDPKKFAAELNRSLNFISAKQYDLIDSFQEQGRKAEALGVIYEALGQRGERLGQNLGLLDRTIRDFKKTFSDMFEEAFDTQRLDTFEGKLRSVQKALRDFDTIRNPLSLSAIFGKSKEQLTSEQRDLSRGVFRERENADAESLRAQTVQEKIATKSIIDGYEKRAKFATVLAEKLDEAKRIFKVNADAGTPISEERQKAILAQVRKEFTPKEGGKKPRDPRKSQLALDLEDIRNEADALTQAYDNAEKILEARRAANLVDDREYYDAKAAFARLNADAQETALQAEIERLEREKVTGADALDNERKIVEAKAKLAKVRADAVTTGEVIGIQDKAAIDKLTRSYVDAAVAAQEYLDTISRQNDREVAGIGQGNRFRAQQADLTKVEDKLIARRAELDADKRRGQMEAPEYAIHLAIAEETYRREVGLVVDKWQKIDAANENGMHGMTEALRNYADEARNVAAITEEVFGNALHGLEDAFVELGTTGKLTFRDLANTIHGDLVRAGYRTLIGKGIESLGLNGKDGLLSAAGIGKTAAQTTAISAQTTALALQTTATNTLTVAAEAAAAALTALASTSAGGSASGAANILGSVIGMFGGGYNYTGDASGSVFSATGEAIRGRRALGGPVSARGMYRVNENGPELLTVAGNQYLMTGDQSGKVSPVDGGKSSPSINQTINFYNNGPVDRNTQSQVAAAAYRGGQRATARNM